MSFITGLRALASSARAPVAALLLVSLALQGCAAVVLTAAGVAGGAGVNHTLNGIAYKTFNNSVAELRAGTLRTLEDMDMTVIEDKETEDGWEIKATAIKRVIDIELERLSKRATRMRVVANEGKIFFKDAATATEIIILTAENLAPAT
ncbi:MAG: DUF3568 family protein [Proteobacteria bacterium]|nr:DUF3568 family protein [Pseudomonadota bacterium]